MNNIPIHIKKNIYKSIINFVVIKILLFYFYKNNGIQELFKNIILKSIIIFLIRILNYPISLFIYKKIEKIYQINIRKQLLYQIINFIISNIIKNILYKILYNKYKFNIKLIIISIFYITFYSIFIKPIFINFKITKFINDFIYDLLSFYNLDLMDDGEINKKDIELHINIISSLLDIILNTII
jgi:hypothetical protein